LKYSKITLIFAERNQIMSHQETHHDNGYDLMANMGNVPPNIRDEEPLFSDDHTDQQDEEIQEQHDRHDSEKELSAWQKEVLENEPCINYSQDETLECNTDSEIDERGIKC